MERSERYRRACKYRAFIPDRLAEIKVSLDAETAGAVSHAEQAIAMLNAPANPALAEARSDTGEKLTPTAREILANIDAMELAIDQASAAAAWSIADIVAIHARLMTASPTPRVAGALRDEQNWIGGNDYNPCGADFVPPPPSELPP